MDNKKVEEKIFKERRRKVVTAYISPYEVNEVQCPFCKTWFTCWADKRGVLQHISIVAKYEAVGKLLKEIKMTPHFDFWKQNTKKSDHYYIKRDWTI